MKNSELLESIDKLINMNTLEITRMESIFSVSLIHDEDHSTTAYDFFKNIENHEALSSKNIKKVEFRSPKEPNKPQFLHIFFKPESGIDSGMIIERYGQPEAIAVPTPQERFGTGVSAVYSYDINNWEVSFSIGESSDGGVLSVALYGGGGKTS